MFFDKIKIFMVLSCETYIMISGKMKEMEVI